MDPDLQEQQETQPTQMLSFRMEKRNVASMDMLARAEGISRSDWIRRAILAQIVADLLEQRKGK